MDNSVTMSEHELESLLRSKERLEEQVANLEARMMVQPLSSGVGCFDSRLATRISRPAWIAFVIFQSMIRSNQDLELQQALNIGLSEPIPVRLTMEETAYLSRQIIQCFGRFGVVVRIEVERLSLNPEEVDGMIMVGPSYHPVSGLPLAVEEATGMENSHTTAWGSQQSMTWPMIGPHRCLREACTTYNIGPESLPCLTRTSDQELSSRHSSDARSTHRRVRHTSSDGGSRLGRPPPPAPSYVNPFLPRVPASGIYPSPGWMHHYFRP